MDYPFQDAICASRSGRKHLADAIAFNVIPIREDRGAARSCTFEQAERNGAIMITIQLREQDCASMLAVFARLEEAMECLRVLQVKVPRAEAFACSTDRASRLNYVGPKKAA